MDGFLLQATIYLAAAVITVPIAKRIGLGSVLGYLIAGVIIGPITGLVGYETKDLQHFAEFGVVMMLFIVGLESDIEPFKGLLLGLLFITVGAGINFTILTANLVGILGMTLTVMAIKGAVLAGLGFLFKLKGAISGCLFYPWRRRVNLALSCCPQPFKRTLFPILCPNSFR